MIKFLVTWVVINLTAIPCPGPDSGLYDKYGRYWESNLYTLAICYESEVLEKERIFNTYKEAKAFIDSAEAICKTEPDCGMRDFKIIEFEASGFE